LDGAKACQLSIRRARTGEDAKVKFLVLGAGRMGYAVAYDLIRSPRVEQVIITDTSVENLKKITDQLGDSKITPVELDVTKIEEVIELMTRCNVAIGCVGYAHNYELSKAALNAKCSFVDLGGNEEVVEKQFNLDEIAKEQKVTIIPDLGLAPGWYQSWPCLLQKVWTKFTKFGCALAVCR